MATDNEWLRLIYLTVANSGVVTPLGPSSVQVQGTAPDGSPATGNPIQVAGNDPSGNSQALSVSASGELILDQDTLVSALENSNLATNLGSIDSSLEDLYTARLTQAQVQTAVQSALDSSSDVEAIKTAVQALRPGNSSNPSVVAGSSGSPFLTTPTHEIRTFPGTPFTISAQNFVNSGFAFSYSRPVSRVRVHFINDNNAGARLRINLNGGQVFTVLSPGGVLDLAGPLPSGSVNGTLTGTSGTSEIGVLVLLYPNGFEL
ncbi:hypothetical protein HJG54_07595 [Leptolyngbya sp. NK1-12]|uniref:Uncharacterized protein n=1 Tax=Leptolyngbya sp. NK1-12 TaxID=2547451 RepID=A0AA96WCK3_9CYAN|nr:hypothetical protein [Leptolyngbya sp. NK1-12]WNZ22733.1 hypothetical protein HJG54_07595 [Leptolyngbya sp. NK1-12]